MAPRYAVYFAPGAETRLWAFGSSVLGYDAQDGADLPFPQGEPFRHPDWAAFTAEARRYGFHATLKAPFHLKDGVDDRELLAAAREFARVRSPFGLGELGIVLLGAFVALMPMGEHAAIKELAADCVRDFDGFRAPLSAADRARRLAAPLSERQARYLQDWGYPYVFDEFRFHMTLTGPLPPESREGIRAALAAGYVELSPEARIDAIALFRQDSRKVRFRILERFPLGA